MNLLVAIRSILFVYFITLHSVLAIVIEIEKPKDLKKTIATKTNLFVLYTNTKTSEVSNVKTILKSLDGSVAFVDCNNKELKKSCKKIIADDEAYILKHYKDGQFNKDYDRQMTKASLTNFLKDPTGDFPFDEEPSAKDVIHITSISHLEKLMRKSPDFLLMFYTNWCGFCKRIKPFYAQVATEMKGKHVIAAMDMEKPENNPARKIFNISGFPTLQYFENTIPRYTFEGDSTKEGIINFLENPSEPPVRHRDEEWADDTNSEIVHLTSKNFDIILREEKAAMVVFHAAFCGHCKSLKPKYEAAAVQMKNKGISGMLAAVDAQKEHELGTKFGVKGYPTLKFFEFGEFKFDINLREADPIVRFMENPDAPPVVEVEQEVSWEEEDNEVVFLNEETFKPFLKKTKHVLCFFFAPWCGHCKASKPEIIKAAAEFKDDSKVAFAAIDCTKHQGICSAYDVRGYPTLKYFNYLKTMKDYRGGRKADDFIKFMQNPDQEVEKPKTETTPFTSDKVLILNEKTFESTLKKHSSALVFFGQEWCGWCKKLKPIYSEAAELLSQQGIKGTLVAVDCGSSGDLCGKFDIKGYPAIKFFKNGKFSSDYNKERTTEAILEFLKSNGAKDEL